MNRSPCGTGVFVSSKHDSAREKNNDVVIKQLQT